MSGEHSCAGCGNVVPLPVVWCGGCDYLGSEAGGPITTAQAAFFRALVLPGPDPLPPPREPTREDLYPGAKFFEKKP